MTAALTKVAPGDDAAILEIPMLLLLSSVLAGVRIGIFCVSKRRFL